ncbi:MBL fold metallo-hydrolase [Chloroflexota bacterium]
MKIKYLAHASFLITSDKGTRIITDPYTPGGPLSYGKIKEAADIVTQSHDHFDHNDVAAVQGNPELINQSGTTQAKGIKFTGIPTAHDESDGKERGNNIIFCFEVDGIKLCHLGDLGHQLSTQQKTQLGNIDILFIPVGGAFTIDAKGATKLTSQLAPKIIIPMHFKTDKCELPLARVDEFLQGKTDVTRLEVSEAEFKAGVLPASAQIVVLTPAL